MRRRECCASLERRLQDSGGRSCCQACPAGPHLDGCGARRCRECAQVPLQILGLAGHVRFAEPPHVEVVGPSEKGQKPLVRSCPQPARTRVHVGVRVSKLVGVHAAAKDGVLGELNHLGNHAPRRLKLPPLAVLELHEARHEGAAGEAVGPVQPLDPGAQHGTSFLQGNGERPRRSAMSAVCGPYRPSQPSCARGEPSPSGHAALGESRSPREQVAHGVGLPAQA